MVRDVGRVQQRDPRALVDGAEERAVGVAQLALVVPDHRLFLYGALLDHVFDGERHAVTTRGGVDVSSAEEEAVDGGGGAFAGGGVVEFGGGIGGEGGEEAFEIGLVDAVASEGGGVCAVVVEVCRISSKAKPNRDN